MGDDISLGLSPEVDSGWVNREVLANERDGRISQIVTSALLKRVIDTSTKRLQDHEDRQPRRGPGNKGKAHFEITLRVESFDLQITSDLPEVMSSMFRAWGSWSR